MAIPGNMLSQVTESVDPNTSGWAAALNATISLGTGGRNGNGLLVVKSVAAGEMQARTISSYPVTAGTAYQAFADAEGATVPERIGIRWLDTSAAEISTTWSLTTAAASATLHRIAVAGAAPVNAVRAQVVLSSTPAAGNVTSSYENVYLGLPQRTLGNLLDFNTESPDVDASGWAVDANCTISRQAPAVQWPVNYYLAGGQVIALTVTANGNASVKTTTAPTVTPGVEYIAFGYINPPTAASACWYEIRFVDGSGTVLSSQRSTIAAPGTSWYRQIASAIAPAGAVGVVVAAGITSGTAGQVMRIDSVAVVDAAAAPATGLLGPIPAGTIVPFSDAEFEQGTGTWAVSSGSGTLSRSTPWGNTARNNFYSLKVAFAGAGTTVLHSAAYPLSTTTGVTWGAEYYLNVPGTGWSHSLDLLWYDATSTLISSATPPTQPLTGAGWYDISEIEGAPAGAASVAMQITIIAPGAGTAYVDTASIRLAVPRTQAQVQQDTASVLLTIRELHGGDTMSVWRVAQDGTRTLVRGPDGLLDGVAVTTETLVVEDYEAPLGVAFTYYEEVSSSGTVYRTDIWEPDAAIAVPDGNVAWLKDPGNPQRNTQVMVQVGPDWQRPIDQASYVVKGRRNKVVLSGVRNGREGDLTIWTRSDDERAALNWLLDSGNVLLWQAAPGMGVTDMYVTAGQTTEARVGGTAREPWRSWTIPLIEADMPVTTGVNGSAGRTWQDVLTEFDTWGDVLNAYATWETVLLDQRKG